MKSTNEIAEIMHYLEGDNQNPIRDTQHCKFVMTMLGKLFIQQFRIIDFINQSELFMSRANYCNNTDYDNIIVKFFEENHLKQDRNRRIETLALIQQTIGSIQVHGKFIVYLLYVKNRSYSMLREEQLVNTLIPKVIYLKNQQYFEKGDAHQKLNARETGIVLHEAVECYIRGAGVVYSEKIKEKIKISKFPYNIDRVINTVNFIIGNQMIKGGFHTISTEKQFEFHEDRRKPSKFNRLDLILRNEDRLLVIDWKFSVRNADKYLEHYMGKVQNYLRIAKMYFNCKVEFQLYCITSKSIKKCNLYYFTSKVINKEIPVFQLDDQMSISSNKIDQVVMDTSEVIETDEIEEIQML